MPFGCLCSKSAEVEEDFAFEPTYGHLVKRNQMLKTQNEELVQENTDLHARLADTTKSIDVLHNLMEKRQRQTMAEIKRLNTIIQDLTKDSEDSKNKLDRIKEENYKKHGHYLERMDRITKELDSERSRNADLANQNKHVLELRHQVAKLQIDSRHWKQRSESAVARAKELSAKLADADILHHNLESQLEVNQTRYRRSLASAATEADALSRQLRASAQDYEYLALKIACLDNKHSQARTAWEKERRELELKADQLEDELQYRELKSRQEKRSTEGKLEELCEELDDLLDYVGTFFIPRDSNLSTWPRDLYID